MARREMKFHIGVKVLLRYRQEFLVLAEETSGHSIPTAPYWDLPGGRIQEGESMTETLHRELFEETGIKHFPEPHLLDSVISNHKIALSPHETVGLALVIYSVSISDRPPIRLSQEHTAYEWVDRQELAKRLAAKYPPDFTALLRRVDDAMFAATK